jgi:hypothetical protein
MLTDLIRVSDVLQRQIEILKGDKDKGGERI